jgi:hypothetical protein
MQSLIEEAKIVSMLVPASRSSAASGDYVNMENYDKLTIIFDVGAVTAGGNVFIQQAKTAAGASAAKMANIDYFHKRTASSDTYTRTATTAASSADAVVIGNSSDNKTFVVEVRASQLSSGFKFVNVLVPGAFSGALTCCIGIAHKARYAQSAPPTAIA